MKLTINIQHTPKRPRHLKMLLDTLEPDDDTVVNVIEDDVSTWSGCKKCLTKYDPDTTHILTLQDDVVVCRDFIKTAKLVASLRPINTITLFTPNQMVTQAIREKRHWLRLKIWFMAQGYIMPVATAQNIIKFAEEHTRPDHHIDDEKMAMYFYVKNEYVWATVPSLVDHLGWGSTTIQGREVWSDYFEPSRRVARCFPGVENSALDIDWTQGLSNPLTHDNGDFSCFASNYVPDGNEKK